MSRKDTAAMQSQNRRLPSARGLSRLSLAVAMTMGLGAPPLFAKPAQDGGLQPPQVAPAVTLTPMSSNLGDFLNYELTVTQDAAAQEALCRIEIAIAAGFRQITGGQAPFGWSLTERGLSLIWEADPGACLEPGASIVLHWTAYAPQGNGRGGTYTHEFVGTTESGYEHTESIDVRVGEARLEPILIEFLDENGGLLQRGDYVTYRFSIANQGDADATGVIFRSPIPLRYCVYVPQSTELNGVPVPDEGHRTPLRSGMSAGASGSPQGVIPPGETAYATARVQVKLNAPIGHELLAKFFVNSSMGNAGHTELRGPTIAGGSGRLDFTGPAEGVPCTPLPFEIVLSADGEGAAFDTYCLIDLPASFEYVPGSAAITPATGGPGVSVDPILIGSTLYFNHDGSNGNPGNDPLWDIAPGDDLTIAFELQGTGCQAGEYHLTAKAWARDGEAGNLYEIHPDGNLAVAFPEIRLAIEQTPAEPEGWIGEAVAWTLQVQASGHGDVPNITVIDRLAAGLTYDPAGTHPAPSHVHVDPATGETRLRWSDIANLPAGSSEYITVSAIVDRCSGHETRAIARWGCDPSGPCQSVQARASLDLQLVEPALAITVDPPTIQVPSCSPSGPPVTVMVTNTGGPARDLQLTFTHAGSPLAVTDVIGADHVADPVDTFLLGDLSSGSKAFTFHLRHQHSCARPSGTYTLEPRYTNDCEVLYTTPPAAGGIEVLAIGNVTLDIAGPIEVPAGTHASYRIDLSYPGGPPPAPVHLEAAYPHGFRYNGDATPAPDAGFEQGAAISTWTLDPAQFDGAGHAAIVFTMKARNNRCGEDGTLAANAEIDVPCGDATCAQHAATSLPVANDCPIQHGGTCDITFDRWVNGAETATVAPCTEIEYENRIEIAQIPLSTLWDDMTFEADAAEGQIFLGYRDFEGNLIPGRVQVALENGPDDCRFSFVPERDGENRISLNFNIFEQSSNLEACDQNLNWIMPQGHTVIIKYVMTAPTEAGLFFDFGRMIIHDDDPLACNGLIAEPVEITVAAATMQARLDLPPMVDACGAGGLASITLTKTGASGSYDNVLYFSTGDFFYIDDLNDPDYFAPRFYGLPNVGVPTRTSEPGVMWKLGDLPPGFTEGRIEFPVRKRCTDGTTRVRLVYDTACGDDDTDNIDENSRESLQTDLRPTYVRRGDVTLLLTPETVVADQRRLTWTLYATNGGSGTVHNLAFYCSRRYNGLRFLRAECFDGAGHPVSGGFTFVPEEGSGRYANGTIAAIPAGETWSVEIEARTDRCNGQALTIDGWWGCLGDTCQTNLHTESRIFHPADEVIATFISPTRISGCEATELTARIKNASLIQAGNPIVRLTLPPGLEYVENGTVFAIGHAPGTTLPAIKNGSGGSADPDFDGDDLVWHLKQHLTKNYLSAGDTVLITFQLRPEETFTAGTLTLGGTHQDACGQNAYIVPANAVLEVTRPEPDDFAFTTALEPVATCGADETLTIGYRNTGAPVYGPAELRLELPPGLAFTSGSAALTYPTEGGGALLDDDPDESGSGEGGDPYILTWELPSSLVWQSDAELTLSLDVSNPPELQCAHFPESAAYAATLTVRTCAGRETELAIGPHTNTAARLEALPEIAMTTADQTPNAALTRGDRFGVQLDLTNGGDAPLAPGACDFFFAEEALEYINAEPAPSQITSGRLRWTGAAVALDPGASAALRLQFRVRDDAALGTPSALRGRYYESCCDLAAEISEALTINGGAALEIEIHAMQARLIPGEPVAYELTLTNTGFQALRDVDLAVTPNLPGMTYAESDYDQARIDFTGTAQAPTWRIAGDADGLQGGESETIRLTYETTTDEGQLGTPTGSGAVTIVARIAAASNMAGEPLASSRDWDEDEDLLPIGPLVAAMDLQTVPSTATVHPGGEFTYLATITNTGDAILSNVNVHADAIPAGLTYLGFNADEEVGETLTHPPTFSIATLGLGASKLIAMNFQASENPADLTDPVFFTMLAEGEDPGGGAVVAVLAQAQSPVNVPGLGLSVYKLAHPGIVVPGDDIQFDVTVTNTGDQTLHNIRVRDVLPEGLTFAGAPQLPPGVIWTGSSAPPKFRIPELGAGAGLTFSFNAEITADTTLLSDPVVNRVRARGVNAAGDTVRTETFRLRLPLATPEASINIEKTGADPVVVPGEPVSYFLTVTNTGDVPLSDVHALDDPPVQFAFFHATHDADVVQISTSPPTFQIAQLAPYDSKTIGISFHTDADYATYPAEIENHASAWGEDPAGTTLEADFVIASLPVVPKGPAIQVGKVNTEPRLTMGRETTYLLTVSNRGDQPLTDVVVTDMPVANLMPIHAQHPTHIIDLGTFPPSYLIPELPVHGEEILALTFEVVPTPNAGSVLVTNAVIAEGYDEAGNAVSDSTFINLPAYHPASRLDLVKKPTQGEVMPGGTVTYILTLDNSGENDMTDATIRDIVPPGLTFAFANLGPGVQQVSTNPPVFSVADLPSGASATVTVTFNADPNPAVFTVPIENVATAQGYNEANSLVRAAPDTASLPLADWIGELDVQKVPTTDRIIPGEEVNYLITIANTGNEELNEIVVTDLMQSPGLTFLRADADNDIVQTAQVPPTFAIPGLKVDESAMISLFFEAIDDPLALDSVSVNVAEAYGYGPGENLVTALPDSALLPLIPNPGSIDIEKIAVDPPFPAGALGHFLLTVTNTGTVPLADIQVADVLPTGLTFVDAEPAATQPIPGSLGWDLAALNPGESHTIVLTVGVDYALHGESVTNTASVEALTPDLVWVSDADATTTPCLAEDSSIHLDKLANETRIVLGGQISYHLLVANDGGLPLENVVVRDTIPNGLIYVNADFDDQRLEVVSTEPIVEIRLLPGQTLAPVESEAITLFFDASRDYVDYELATLDSTVVNRAYVSATDPLDELVTDSDAAQLDLISPHASIQVHYTHTTSEIIPGERTTYLVTLENIGDQVLYEVRLAIPDLLAQGLEYETSNYDATKVTEAHGPDTLRWELPDPFPPGAAEQIRISYQVLNDISLMPEVITSTAVVTAIDEEDYPVGDEAEENVPLSPKRGAVLIDNTAAQGEIMPGELVTYVLTVTAGPELDLVDLVVAAQDLSTDGLTLFATSYDETVFLATGDYSWTALDTVRAGAQEEIRITYRAHADVDSMPAIVVTTAQANAFDVYGRAVTDEDEESLPVLLPESHLLLEKIALTSALVPGEPITYLITATNNGNQELAELTITEPLPSQLTTFASYHDSSSIVFDGNPTNPTWTFAPVLEPGEAIMVRLVCESDPDPSLYDETLTNVADATAIDEGHEELQARATDTVPVHMPDVAVDVTKIPNQNLVIPGESISYSLTVRNVGRTDLLATTLTEEIPPGLSFEASYHNAAEVTLADTSDAVVWEIGLLEPGRSVDVQIFFAVSENANEITNPVVNTVTAEATGPGNVAAVDLAEATVPVQESAPGLLIEKRATTSVAEPGARLEYEIHVTNKGNTPLSNVTVTDSLARGITFADARFDPDRVELASTYPLLVWNMLGDMEPGDRRSIYLSVDLAADPDSLSDPVVNTAEVTGVAPNEETVSATATESLPLQDAAPRVTIQIFTTEPVVWPGREILYTVQVTNTGNRDIAKGYITNELPVGLSYVGSVFDQAVLAFGGNRTDPRWTVISGLPVGATETITVRLQADYDHRSISDPVENLVTVVAWDKVDPEPFTDTDFETTPLADVNPALNLDVVSTSGVVVPGEYLTYLISLTNIGDEDLYEITVTDTLPSGLSVFSTDYDPLHLIEERGSFAGDPRVKITADSREVISWSMAEMPIRAIEVIRLTCAVTEDTNELDSLVVNQVHVTAASMSVAEVSDADVDPLVVVEAGSAITLSKTALAGEVIPGERISYLLTVRNAGETELSNARIVDEIPTGLAFAQTDFDNTALAFSGATTDSAVWIVPALPVGGYEQIRITYLASSNLIGNAADDTLTTTAYVRAYDPSEEVVGDQDSEILPIHPQRAGLQLLKWADATGELAVQGTEIAYHIQIVNTGEQDLTPVTVIDYMPSGLRYLESDQAIDSVVVHGDQTLVYWTPEPNGSGQNILHPMESWEVLIRARIDTMLVDGAVLENRATATGTPELGEDVISSDVSRVLAGLPMIPIEKTVDKPVAKPGEKLTYTITYRNAGTADAENVVVIDELPAYMTYVQGSASGGAFYESLFHSITRTVENLEIDQGAIFSYQVLLSESVPLGTRIPNVAQVYADAVSPAYSDTAWVMVADKAAELVKTVDRTVGVVGDTLTYTLTYHNLSDEDYAAVTVSDPVPSELDYLTGSTEPDGLYDAGTRTLTWELGALPAGHVGAVSFKGIIRADATATGSIANAATMMTDGVAVPSNTAVTLVVEDIGVALTKRVNRDLAVPGDTLLYTLRVANVGPSPLTAITITDAVPSEVTYAPPTADVPVSDPDPIFDPLLRTLTWEIGVIEPEESVSLTFKAMVAQVTSGTMVSNIATVLTNETEPIVSNPANTLIQYPELAITKTPDRNSVVVGEEVTYTIIVSNEADGTTDSTWVADQLPDGFAYVAGSTILRSGGEILSQADPEEETPPLVWTLGRLGAYQADTLTYRAEILGAAGPGVHENRATACGTTPLGRTVCTDPAVAGVEVIVPEITITKTTAERSVDYGDPILYRITVQNNSAAPVTDFEIRDHLPVGFQLLPGSCVLNGARIDDPVLYADGLRSGALSGAISPVAGGNVVAWSLGRLGEEEEIELSYLVLVGLNASRGVAKNLAEGVGLDEGGGRVVAGPAEARVFVLDDELPGRLRGRVIVDCDGDFQPDQPQRRRLRFAPSGTLVDEQGNAVAGLEEGEMPPYQGIEILIEDGRRVVTDDQGEFFFYPLEYGDHAVYLDPRSLAEETTILSHDSEFFTVLEGGEARIEFRICPPAPKRGSIHLLKSVDPPEVMAIKRVLEPEVYLVEGILFDPGSASLRPEAGRVLAEAAKRLSEDPTATASVEGHTDIRPIRTTEFTDNYALSEARARVVRDALVGRFGLDPARFAVKGYGPERPIAPSTTARNLSLNRRTEIIILPSLAELTTAALFEPSQVTFQLRVVYEGNFRPGEGALREVMIADAVPHGLEYVLGSSVINAQAADDPEMMLSTAADAAAGVGRSERLLKWSIGTLRPGDVVEIRYAAVITDVPRPAQPSADQLAQRLTAEGNARHVAEIDSLLRDPEFRNHRHLWENRAYLQAVRFDGSAITSAPAGADLQLAFERTIAPITITVDDVLFETARAQLVPEAFGILDPAADIIRARPGCRVRIEGHTDIRPIHTAEFPSNQELSEARARAVFEYFTKIERLDEKIFSIRGFGPRRPIANNETASDRQKNRRVEIIISGDEISEQSFKPVKPGALPEEVKLDLR